MEPKEAAAFRRVWEVLGHYGLVLMTDPQFPSVASLVAGEPVRGSWWSHPKTNAIWRVAFELGQRPDITEARLVSGKVTLVHRKLWPALRAVGNAREKWQLEGLSRPARSLLARVKRAGRLRTDRLPDYNRKSKASGETARELERRLLVHGEEFHSERGAHAKWLESWERWARRRGIAGEKMKPEEAKKKLEEVVRALNEKYRAAGCLPWHETERAMDRGKKISLRGPAEKRGAG